MKIVLENKDLSMPVTFDVKGGEELTVISIIRDGFEVQNALTVNLREAGARANIYALYENNKRVVNETRINHLAPGCSSKQLYKGIIGVGSYASFRGKIYVDRCATGTVAMQECRHLLLDKSGRSWVEPHLEIYNSEVKCSHGATCGTLSEEQLFYLLTRGIDLGSARGLLLEAFAGEILEMV